ncbi:pathogen-related protein [Nematostella vectensis]|uniref:pathogen-related protein n=1 Tax=Nematostella vectensis TaxID=45351 RepID=UPI00207768C5|nr:pathogen-related protein [Nematostella vectensis]
MADRPVRQFMDDPNIKWRTQKPDYTKADKEFLSGVTKRHPKGSLERTVEDLVKTWEMEASHKVDLKDWGSVDQNCFTMGVNNQVHYTGHDVAQRGSYNLLITNTPLYDASSETLESSHKLFKTAFNNGFSWEVLEVFSDPPRMAFTWRHWARWTGPYRDHPPSGELLQMFGSAVVEVDGNLKIKSINLYYDPNQILAKLEGKRVAAFNAGEQSTQRHSENKFNEYRWILTVVSSWVFFYHQGPGQCAWTHGGLRTATIAT